MTELCVEMQCNRKGYSQTRARSEKDEFGQKNLWMQTIVSEFWTALACKRFSRLFHDKTKIRATEL
jgi:hypothetical protein